MTEILNQETIDSLRDLGDDFFQELIMTFLETARDQMQQILEAVRNSDWAGLEAAAHGLKGSSYGQGAEELGEICQELERRGREKDVEGIDLLVIDLEKSFESTCNTLEQFLGKKGDGATY